jgi:hypothetical protein
MNLKIFDSPDGFFEAIPKGLEENLNFRMNVLSPVLDKDSSLQKIVLKMMLENPKIYFNAFAWTLNPRLPVGLRNRPFILRPKQEKAVDTITSSIIHQNDVGINKARDEGATEIVTKLIALLSILPDSYYIVGSRNKDLVDSKGDPYTLFAKIDYAFDTMPGWLKKTIQYNPLLNRKDMQLNIPAVNSVIRGETTNESFSAGRRSTAIFLDEFGRVEPRVAESIEGSVHDVTGCVIYGSTHWYGESHPFARALRKPSTAVVNLLWYENPEKAAGLYKTPDYNVIEIVDKEYYTTNYPQIFTQDFNWTFKLSELEKELLSRGYTGPSPKFIADKCEGLPPGADVRSPWHDKEEERRQGNFRDFVSNVWASPVGSQDSVFSTITLARIETSTISDPRFNGDFGYQRDADGHVVNAHVIRSGRQRFRWWGEVNEKGMPIINHNYVIGCDPSLGTGNSNSVAAILDVHTHDLVGTWVCPNTPPEEFADIVAAMATIFNNAYVVFENNGGHGINFGRRLVKDGCRRVYTQRVEDGKTHKTQNKWGWNSNPNSKSDLLSELGIALSEGLKTERSYTSCVIHDEEILKELRSYVFYENGDIGAEEYQDLKSGARKRHGDRVIAVGLCVLGSKYQHKAPKIEKTTVNIDSFEYRKKQLEEKLENDSRTERRFLY